MKKIKHFFRSRRSQGEVGQALILVLLFLAMGSLTLVPTLSHISTALKTGEIYEQNTNELYTADAGIEDGLWRIKYDFMGGENFQGVEDYNPYDFVTAWPYVTEDINGMTANFTIKNVWFPTDFNLADPDDPDYMSPEDVTEMMDLEKLIVNGSNDLSDNVTPYTYKIMVDFNPGAGDNLTIKSLGVWLPSGFTYVADSCSLLDGNPFTDDYYPDDFPPAADAPGGSAVLWSYDPDYPYLTDFPGYNPDDNTFVFTLSYTKENPNWWPAAIAWVTTEMHDAYGSTKPNDVPVSWDIDTRYFKMVSAARDTSVEAYTSKNDLRQMGDAMSGDYVAIGNALLKDDDGDHVRDDWHTPSSFTMDTIPEEADAIYAYLYWTGWIAEDEIDDIFSDDCENFNEWDRSSSPDTQTTVPTAEGINSGYGVIPQVHRRTIGIMLMRRLLTITTILPVLPIPTATGFLTFQILQCLLILKLKASRSISGPGTSAAPTPITTCVLPYMSTIHVTTPPPALTRRRAGQPTAIPGTRTPRRETPGPGRKSTAAALSRSYSSASAAQT